jgi:hypothetical protein
MEMASGNDELDPEYEGQRVSGGKKKNPRRIKSDRIYITKIRHGVCPIKRIGTR